ncbi:MULTISPECIES: MBL fold metallo-hydrolase [unclassified Vibrio]|uniref:MBL fold metallo-hydrolase n=1 Tax=unclassified Vibrio TaxID=2614977 RepID=UPI00159E3E2A|nr:MULTISPECIES: MBL fold metallo-hydrolase [unclassified Vibrio]NVN83588.1 MBL fold metallo-hydrolase [Vibrio sp. Scap16]QLE94267.1 MBL fold metallo-hydrolase [Vibrio sp. Scap24]
MKIHHLRSATFIIESGDHYILIDPMLGKKGSLPPFSVFRAKMQKNPTVEMPHNANELLDKVTHTLITHSQTFGIKALQHGDHLDGAGEDFLSSRQLPVTTPSKDKAYLEKYGLNVESGIDDWQTIDFLGGNLTAIPAQHGHGWIHKVMANGVGFFLELPNEPSIYISGDTVLTDHVKRALSELKPDITVVAAGQAQMDVGQPLLMPQDEVMEFIRLSPNKVIANHMEALNHCAIDHGTLLKSLEQHDLASKVAIPADGETLEYI